MTGPVRLPAAMAAEVVAHARGEAPNEACGLVLGDAPFERGGRALRFVPCRNAAASPDRFEIDPHDLIRIAIAADDAGEVVWAVVHSHLASAARPSPTDIRAALDPEALHLIVGPLEDAVVPPMRAWRIEADRATELTLRIG